MASLSSTLCFMGALLFTLGLLTGFGIPSFRSPRIGLSAHLAAIESGLALIAFGLLLPHLALSAGWAGGIGHSLWVSLYVMCIGLVLAAIFGTGKVVPLAGAGLPAKRWQETTAFVLISIGSVGTAGAVVALLAQWRWAA
jgi:(hydroxyamino)benzene mutase